MLTFRPFRAITGHFWSSLYMLYALNTTAVFVHSSHVREEDRAMEREQERQRLEHERRIVEQEIERLKKAIQAETEFEPEDGDPDLIEREKSVSLLQSFEARLGEILDALKTLDEGTYGICERCGQPIDPERLKIMPETRLCVSCKAEIERQSRRRPSSPIF